jgi:hypothetical protein
MSLIFVSYRITCHLFVRDTEEHVTYLCEIWKNIVTYLCELWKNILLLICVSYGRTLCHLFV